MGEDAVTDDKSTHLALFKVCSDYPSPDNILKKMQKKITWKSAEFDQIMKRAGNFIGTEQRQADKILCQDEAVVIPIYYEKSPVLLKPKVQGWHYAAMGGQQLDRCSFKEATY